MRGDKDMYIKEHLTAGENVNFTNTRKTNDVFQNRQLKAVLLYVTGVPFLAIYQRILNQHTIKVTTHPYL